MYVLVKDETKATAHSMPDEVCGFTDILDSHLQKILLYDISNKLSMV